MSARKLLGLIGANIGGSLAPALHEDACAAAGIVGHYHLMDVDVLVGRRLEDLFAAVRAAGFAGINVTYPFKEAVIPLLDALSPEAGEIGAVNTVTIDGTGRAVGHNTDRSGFRQAFAEAFGAQRARGHDVLLLGAGGAGRAVAFAMMDLGVTRLRIYDHDPVRAASLCADLVHCFGRARCEQLEDPVPAVREVAGIVNTTPLGMRGHPGLPLDPNLVEPQHFLADVIYTPLETELVLAAKARGAATMGGAGMCVHQAVDAFRHFTGRTPDVVRMKQTFEAACARRDAASNG